MFLTSKLYLLKLNKKEHTFRIAERAEMRDRTMLNFLFAFYVCLIPLLLLWACGLGLGMKNHRRSAGSGQNKPYKNRPVTALKLAANERRHATGAYSFNFPKSPEYFEVAAMSKRRVSYLPNAELNLITADKGINRRENARSAG